MFGILFNLFWLLFKLKCYFSFASKNLAKNLSQYSFGSLIFGVISAILGIFLFQMTNFPAGPLIVISGFLIFLVSIILKKG